MPNFISHGVQRWVLEETPKCICNFLDLEPCSGSSSDQSWPPESNLYISKAAFARSQGVARVICMIMWSSSHDKLPQLRGVCRLTFTRGKRVTFYTREVSPDVSRIEILQPFNSLGSAHGQPKLGYTPKTGPLRLYSPTNPGRPHLPGYRDIVEKRSWVRKLGAGRNLGWGLYGN